MRKSKLLFLDGLRGLMALNVVINHFVVVFYPQMYFGSFAQELEGKLSLFSKTSLSVLVNGNVAVQYFLVLTGFLVGRSFFTAEIPMKREHLLDKCAKRYKRLLPVVAAASIFSFLLMKMDWMYHFNIVEHAMNGEFLTSYYNFKPTIWSLLVSIFYDPFLNGSAYVGPFWMLRYEFWGYIFCLLTCYFTQKHKARRFIYIVVALLSKYHLNDNYAPLYMGIFVADLYYCSEWDTTYLACVYHRFIYTRWFTLCCLLGGSYLASCPSYIEQGSVWIYFTDYLGDATIRAAGVAMVIYGLLQSPGLIRILEWKPFLWLGERSFVIFAFHWPIMLSLQAYLFDLFRIRMTYDSAALSAFSITLFVILLLSHGLHLLIETHGPRWVYRIRMRCSTLCK